MPNKKNVTITVDADLWELAKKIPGGRSKFINAQLELAIGIEEDEESILQKEINDFQEEINVRQSRICEIRERKRKEAKIESDLSEVKNILERFDAARGFVAENQLRVLSRNQDVDYDILHNLCLEMEIEIKKYFEPPKEGKQKGGLFR